MAQKTAGHLDAILEEIIPLYVSPEAFEWLKEKAHSAVQLPVAFAAVPRKTGKKIIALSTEQDDHITAARPGFTVDGWTADRLARVWLLMNVDAGDKEKYLQAVERLFISADVNELVALYSALPVLEYPESWAARCANGIRSNIDDVQEAIMFNNPYPSEYLGEAAWNQLVLKAFFTGKSIHRVTGIDSRANEPLARTLSDYAHERWAAHRSVDPQVWRLVGKFIDKDLFPDIEKLYASGSPTEKEAALLACNDSRYPPAKELLGKNEKLRSAISSGELTWDALAEKKSDYVLQQ